MINIIMISIGVSYIYNLEIVMLLLLINLIIYIYYFLQNYNRTLTKHYMSVLISRICYDNLFLFSFCGQTIVKVLPQSFSNKDISFNLNKGVKCIIT